VLTPDLPIGIRSVVGDSGNLLGVTTLPADLLDLVRRTGRLCLNVDDPGWDDARGYLFNEPTSTLYFPVSKRYLPTRPEGFRVLVSSQPRVLVTGDLLPATSQDDTDLQLALAEASGIEPDNARFMLLDQRTKKARRTRYKLRIRDLSVAP
jgi:hypothetical protein